MQFPSTKIVGATLALTGLSGCLASPCDYTLSGVRTEAITQLSACTDSLDPTPLAQMPTSGTANYAGYTSADISSGSASGDTIIADASLTANFATANVTGTISNATSNAQGNLGNTLTVANGTIVGNTVQGLTINGTLSGYGGQNIAFATSGAGAFAGSSAGNLVIGTTGTVTIGASVGNVNLATIAAKQ